MKKINIGSKIKRKVFELGATESPLCKELKAQLAALQNTKDKLLNEERNYLKSKQEALATKKTLENDIKTTTTKKKEIEDRIAGFQSTINKNNTWLKNHPKATPATKQKLKNENASLKTKIENNQANIPKLQKTIDAKNKNLKNVVDQIETLTNALSEVNKEISDTNSAISDKKTQIANAGC